jgi:uncharacterized protein YehS (DUF1456 family)
MQNNDVTRSLRYILNLSDAEMIAVFARMEKKIDAHELSLLLAREDEEGYTVMDDSLFESFLDGIILQKRGERENKAGEATPQKQRMTNNIVLKKLRIALDLREEDMIEVFKLGNIEVSRSELTALFRREGHKHYKECGDQYLRYFLAGLAIRYKK